MAERRGQLKHDKLLFTASDMPAIVSMHLQTVGQQTVRRHGARPTHVLLTFFNENLWHSPACRRGRVVRHTPGTKHLLALNKDR